MTNTRACRLSSRPSPASRRNNRTTNNNAFRNAFTLATALDGSSNRPPTPLRLPGFVPPSQVPLPAPPADAPPPQPRREQSLAERYHSPLRHFMSWKDGTTYGHDHVFTREELEPITNIAGQSSASMEMRMLMRTCPRHFITGPILFLPGKEQSLTPW
jgi:hypothetical protein